MIPAAPKLSASGLFGGDTDTYLAWLKEQMEIRQGERGDPLDRVVTLRDLQESGVSLRLSNVIQRGTVVPGGVSINIPSSADDPDYTDTTAPPQPSGLQATTTLTAIRLQWNAPSYGSRHARTEILRSPSADFGLAVVVGDSLGNIFTDPVGETGATYYYWIRFITKAKIVGNLNSGSGLAVSTYVLNGVNLADHIIAARHLAAGSLNLAGTAFAGQVVDGAQFAEAAVGNAAINGLVATNLSIANGTLGASKVGSLVVGGANIDSAAVGALDMADGIIGFAEIDYLNAELIYADQLQVHDVAMIGSAELAFADVTALKFEHGAILRPVSVSGENNVSLLFTPRASNDGIYPVYPHLVLVTFFAQVDGEAANQAIYFNGKYTIKRHDTNAVFLPDKFIPSRQSQDVVPQDIYDFMIANGDYPSRIQGRHAMVLDMLYLQAGLLPGVTYRLELSISTNATLGVSRSVSGFVMETAR